MLSTDAIIRELAQTAVAAREKRASLLGSATGVAASRLIGPLGEHLQKAWSGLSPEQQYGLMGAGAGGLYGAATSRPGHRLEDTAYGAGIGGLGGYAGKTLLDSGRQAVAPTKQEQQLALQAEQKAQTTQATTAANEKARRSALMSAGPAGEQLAEYVPEAGPDLGIKKVLQQGAHGGDIASGAATAGAGIGGFKLGQNAAAATIKAVNPHGTADAWQPRTKANANALGNMGLPADIAPGKTWPVPPGELPTPNTRSGRMETAYQSDKSLPRPGVFARGRLATAQMPPGVRRNLSRGGGWLGAGLGLALNHFGQQLLPTKPLQLTPGQHFERQ